MKNVLIRSYFTIAVIGFLVLACNDAKKEVPTQQESEALFMLTMQKHLQAVSNKDIKALKSTLSSSGNIQLILPQSEITNTVDAFIKYHEEWFALPINWTFETKILNTTIGKEIGIAIVEIIYKEPERNGKPYFNRMVVSYALQCIDNKWYVIKDHASSIEKSTDSN